MIKHNLETELSYVTKLTLKHHKCGVTSRKTSLFTPLKFSVTSSNVIIKYLDIDYMIKKYQYKKYMCISLIHVGVNDNLITQILLYR